MPNIEFTINGTVKVQGEAHIEIEGGIVTITPTQGASDSLLKKLIDAHCRERGWPGTKIDKIKALRDLGDFGLVEAKDICDRLYGPGSIPVYPLAA